MDRATGSYYYHQNELWSVAALSDDTGTVLEHYNYDAYGGVSVTDGLGTPIPPNPSGTAHSPSENPFLFTGREGDEETGLYFYRSRFLDSQKGRFLQRDALGYSAGMNLQEYVNSRPTCLGDPFGYGNGDEDAFRYAPAEQTSCGTH